MPCGHLWEQSISYKNCSHVILRCPLQIIGQHESRTPTCFVTKTGLRRSNSYRLLGRRKYVRTLVHVRNFTIGSVTLEDTTAWFLKVDQILTSFILCLKKQTQWWCASKFSVYLALSRSYCPRCFHVVSRRDQ